MSVQFKNIEIGAYLLFAVGIAVNFEVEKNYQQLHKIKIKQDRRLIWYSFFCKFPI
jgi:hypothetical protein